MGAGVVSAPEMTDRERIVQLRRILADVVVDNNLTCEPHPDNKRCVCSTARALRVLRNEEEW